MVWQNEHNKTFLENLSTAGWWVSLPRNQTCDGCLENVQKNETVNGRKKFLLEILSGRRKLWNGQTKLLRHEYNNDVIDDRPGTIYSFWTRFIQDFNLFSPQLMILCINLKKPFLTKPVTTNECTVSKSFPFGEEKTNFSVNIWNLNVNFSVLNIFFVDNIKSFFWKCLTVKALSIQNLRNFYFLLPKRLIWFLWKPI